MKRMVLGLWVALWGLTAASGALEARKRAVLSELQAMSHGYYSAAEWERVSGDLEQLRADAARADDYETVIESYLIESMVYADMRGQTQHAVDLLNSVKKQYAGKPVNGMRRVYASLAEVYAQQGHEQKIADLIREFQQSPHYDPEQYPFEGGLGRDVPLAVTRPRGGNDSVTVSIMQRYRMQARYSRGARLPDLERQETHGRDLRMADYHGSVVLLDFWVPGTVTWTRDLSTLKQLQQQHAQDGFVVIGIPLMRDEQAVERAVREYKLPWRHMRISPRSLATIGVFGEAQNILVGRDGIIWARNARGSVLADLVREAVQSSTTTSR